MRRLRYQRAVRDIGTGARVCLRERLCECTRAYLHSVILLVRGQQKWGDCQQWKSIKTCCRQSVSKHCDLLRISQQTLQERIQSEWEWLKNPSHSFRRWDALLSTDPGSDVPFRSGRWVYTPLESKCDCCDWFQNSLSCGL